MKSSVQYIESVFKASSGIQAQSNEKRAQIDKLRNLDEKIRVEKIEVENLKVKASQMLASGQQNASAQQALDVLNDFDKLDNNVKSLLNEKENQNMEIDFQR